MEKRFLTTEEIMDIINCTLNEFYTIKSLPEPMKQKFFETISAKLRTELTRIKIYPAGIDQLKKKIMNTYRLVNPAKSVGIICGQSIGELNTQSTLNTFHATGIANRTVVQGVPRFLEIIDTNRSETQGAPYSNIFLNITFQSVAELREIIGSKLVYKNFGDLLVKYEVKMTETISFISYTMNLEVMFRYKITLEMIAEKINQPLIKKLVCSPLHLGKIDIYFDENTTTRIVEDQINPKILQTKICGVDKIKNMFFIKQNNDWYIQTDGSNLEDILNLSFVDTFRTYSNDIWEMYNLFGIEAVRSYIIEELINLMPTIHISHITLLADRMTVSGKLRSITRYTRKDENSSVLSKATFEETLSGFLRSAIIEEEDNINGASASIICGKVPKVGSGMNDLILKR